MKRFFDSSSQQELVKVQVTRKSVSQGDDALAPHFSEILFSIDGSILELATKIVESGYLPKIWGGKATWILKNEETILAIIAQEWLSPKCITGHGLSIESLRMSDGTVEVYIDYFAQANPNEIYASLVKT